MVSKDDKNCLYFNQHAMMSEKGFLVFRKSQPSVEVCHFFAFKTSSPTMPSSYFARNQSYVARNFIMLNNILTSLLHIYRLFRLMVRDVFHTLLTFFLCVLHRIKFRATLLFSGDIIRAR